jgi:hypothetical protein
VTRLTLALAGDTMLGRGVAAAIEAGTMPVDEPVAAALRDADLAVLNLECCVSARGSPWPAPGKPFFFRAPPRAAAVLAALGVDAVTLANNHALDYGHDALIDTRRHLAEAGIATVGAGAGVDEARRPLIVERGGLRIGLIGVTDHPRDFAAADGRSGVAFADLRGGLPGWLRRLVSETRARCDLLVVTPHWGPNMVTDPIPAVRRAASALLAAGADLVAGHSAHVFHGVIDRVLFDLGDFVDDYAVDPRLRNDLGLLWLVTVDEAGPIRVDGLPLALDYCFTRLADADEQAWIGRRLARAGTALGGPPVEVCDDRFVIRWRGE